MSSQNPDTSLAGHPAVPINRSSSQTQRPLPTAEKGPARRPPALRRRAFGGGTQSRSINMHERPAGQVNMGASLRYRVRCAAPTQGLGVEPPRGAV